MSFLKNPVLVKQAVKTNTQQAITQRTGFIFSEICDAWSDIEGTTKRLEKSHRLTTLFIQMHTQEQSLNSILLLMSNIIREPWMPKTSVLNIGEQGVKKAICETFQVQLSQLKFDFQSVGDLGQLCQNYKKNQPTQFGKQQPLTVDFVLNEFRRIGDMTGDSVQADRVTVMRRLFQDGSALECRYLTRLLLGKNRFGMQRHTLLVSLADFLCYLNLVADKSMKAAKSLQEADKAVTQVESFKVSNKIIDAEDDDDEEESTGEQKPEIDGIDVLSYEQLLQKIPKDEINISETLNERARCHVLVSRGFARVPSLTYIAKYIFELKTIQINPGIPILPMLAKPTSSATEVFEKVENSRFACEYKYDGFRAQIHRKDGKMMIFSRSQENMSQQFPDVLRSVESAVKIKGDFVIDGEIVPVDDNGVILPFQMLSRRLKIYDEKQQASKITMFIFDIMFVDGVSLMHAVFEQRRSILHSAFAETQLIRFAQSQNIQSEEHLLALLEKAVKDKTEGLIVKTLTSLYTPDRRSRHWLKLKKDYLEGVGDSLDLVPIAGWYGKGKRAGVIGAYLMAAFNRQLNVWETVTSIGTGFSDEILQKYTEKFNECKLQAKPIVYRVADQFIGPNKPDFWINFNDSVVWEVKVANLSISNMHTCCIQQLKEGGIAARLPRLIRERDDKSVENCSTCQFVFERFNVQPDRLHNDENDVILKDNDESSGSLQD